MLSSSMNPYLDAEFTYRHDRLTAGLPRAGTARSTRSRRPASSRSIRVFAHRLVSSH